MSNPEEPHDPVLAARFLNLKSRLLLQTLNDTPESEIHTLIIKQANEAAFLAWLSGYPLLAFPCLFEERILATTEPARYETLAYRDYPQRPHSLHAVTAIRRPSSQGCSPVGVARKALAAVTYLMLLRDHHGRTCRPRLSLSAQPVST